MNKKCQVFTPSDYVEKLLDYVGYTAGLYGKKILENSCGDGNILAIAVERYIIDCKKEGFSRTVIKNGLKKDIVGIEIDKKQSRKCENRLNEILKKNDISEIKWQIYADDYLRRKTDVKFDYIVGNPPYITYGEMKRKDQQYLKKQFNSCKKGKFDYCYAFIEKSLSELKKDGKMTYLIPESIFKTVFGENLRHLMKPYIRRIVECTQNGIFSESLVKSSIVVFEGSNNNDEIIYSNENTDDERIIRAEELQTKWSFCGDRKMGVRFGDYFKVSYVVATLLNKAFILSDFIETDNGYITDDYCIEKEVVRDTETPRNKRFNRFEKIIFPYYYSNERIQHYSKEEFALRFPEAIRYLSRYKTELLARKSDRNAHWFEYGRSQALEGLNKEKILISTVISSEAFVYRLAKACIPYAGMYIVPKTNFEDMGLKKAESVLKSDDFYAYTQDIGIHINGNSVRITAKDIEDYMF